MSQPMPEATSQQTWYTDWQNPQHVQRFDGRSQLDERNLVRFYEAFNDVRLLNQRGHLSHAADLLEVGCATGEMYRYLKITSPVMRYVGVDVSEPALVRARTKYPQGSFVQVDPSMALPQALQVAGLPQQFEVVYSKDVLQHQVQPLEFLAGLVATASHAVILRCRTRDVGRTEWDPEHSCQYHYGGWMPYLVINVDELVAWIQRTVPQAEVIVWRHHMVLGGKEDRFLPKDLYQPDIGGAETAIGIFKHTLHPGRVDIRDRRDGHSTCTWDYRMRHAAQRLISRLRGHH